MVADRVVYADASALVKLVVDESESSVLRESIADAPRLYSSRIAVVEVSRAAVVANPIAGLQEAGRLLDRCDLIDVDPSILDHAARLVNQRLRALDAVHLASALLIRPDELIAYDRRLLQAAERAGLQTASPGA